VPQADRERQESEFGPFAFLVSARRRERRMGDGEGREEWQEEREEGAHGVSGALVLVGKELEEPFPGLLTQPALWRSLGFPCMHTCY
jgi:hypothetical protein